VAQRVDTGERQGYATAMAGILGGLSQGLARLEELAAAPDATFEDEDALASLPALQYTLHAASEAAAGIDPPAEAEASHAELAAALADARDATAEVAEAVAVGGPEHAWPLIYEWRGALFRVRLARLRLAPAPARSRRRRGVSGRSALLVTVVAGSLTLVVGALLDLWPVAAGGLALAAGAALRAEP
jgi:hypothetical protein